MKKPLYLFFLAIGLLGIAIQVNFLIREKSAAPQTVSSQSLLPDGSMPVFSKVPDFTLTERSGEPFSNQQMKGKVWLVDFIFTRCPGICPLLSSRFSHLQEEAFALGDVGLISFSVDPDHDTPAVLRQYADQLQARKEWTFLTGERSEIERIAMKGFLVAFMNDEGAPGGIDHTGKIALVDQNGNIRRYYEGATSDEKEYAIQRKQMLADIQTILKEGGKP